MSCGHLITVFPKKLSDHSGIFLYSLSYLYYFLIIPGIISEIKPPVTHCYFPVALPCTPVTLLPPLSRHDFVPLFTLQIIQGVQHVTIWFWQFSQVGIKIHYCNPAPACHIGQHTHTHTHTHTTHTDTQSTSTNIIDNV